MEETNRVGKAKVVLERWRSYAGWAQFLMVAYLFLEKTDLPLLPLLTAAVLVSAVLLYVDYKYIMPNEFKAMWKLNPEWENRNEA